MRSSPEIFSLNLESRLKELGWTYKDLAEKCGLYESAISNYINKNNVPSLRIIDKMARALQTTTAGLLTDPESKIQPTPIEALKILEDHFRKPSQTISVVELRKIIQDVLSGEDKELFDQVWSDIQASLPKKKKD